MATMLLRLRHEVLGSRPRRTRSVTLCSTCSCYAPSNFDHAVFKASKSGTTLCWRVRSKVVRLLTRAQPRAGRCQVVDGHARALHRDLEDLGSDPIERRPSHVQPLPSSEEIHRENSRLGVASDEPVARTRLVNIALPSVCYLDECSCGFST